jgi:predicted DNA-binding transcriptional regulator YafY
MKTSSRLFPVCYLTHKSLNAVACVSVAEFALRAGVSVTTAYRYWALCPSKSKLSEPKRFVQTVTD